MRKIEISFGSFLESRVVEGFCLDGSSKSFYPPALRWAIITQDPGLFEAILPICQAGSFEPDVQEKIEFYLPHLEEAIPQQAQIKAAIQALPFAASL